MENKALSPNSSAPADNLRQTELSEQLADITAKVLRFTSAGGAAIAIVAGDVAVTKASSGDLAPDIDSRLRLDGSFAGLAIQQGELLYCEDAATDPRVDSAASASLGIRSMVMVPVGEKNNVRGVLAAFSAMPSGFRPTHIAVMRTLADIVNELLIREHKPAVERAPSPRVREVSSTAAPIPVEFPLTEIPRTAAEIEVPSQIPELPIEVTKRLEVITGGASAVPAAKIETAAVESMATRPVQSVKPVEPPVVAEAAKPPAAGVETAQPLFKDRFERPQPHAPVEPAHVAEPRFMAPIEDKRSEKDPLPSIVALVNQQKKAEQESSTAKSDILVPAADPRVEASSTATPARKTATKPVSKPVKLDTPAPVPVRAQPPTFDSPMFRSLEQPSTNSGSMVKTIAVVVIGAVLVIGGAFGVRSYLKSREAATAVSEPAPAPVTENASAAPADSAAAQPTQSQVSVPPPAKTDSKPSSTQDAKTTDANPETPRQKAVIVAGSNASVPRRQSQIEEAPQIALNGRADMGALLSTSKSATPTLSVKRSVLSPPEVIRRVPPKFPEFARRTNPKGDRVVLNVTVGKNGHVNNVQVVRGNSLFAESAANAVRQWQYRPAFLNGEPVESTVEVVVSFTGAQ